MEALNFEGLKWCYGNLPYNDILQASRTLPISYQILERDLRLFASISSGTTCITFRDHFSLHEDIRLLRSSEKPKLVVPSFQKKIVQHTFFPRVAQLVNDLHDCTEINLIPPTSDYKTQLRMYFLLLTRTKYDINRTCTWHIKCKCTYCVAWEFISLSLPFVNSPRGKLKPFTTTTTTLHYWTKAFQSSFLYQFLDFKLSSLLPKRMPKRSFFLQAQVFAEDNSR